MQGVQTHHDLESMFKLQISLSTISLIIITFRVAQVASYVSSPQKWISATLQWQAKTRKVEQTNRSHNPQHSYILFFLQIIIKKFLVCKFTSLDCFHGHRRFMTLFLIPCNTEFNLLTFVSCHFINVWHQVRQVICRQLI